MSADPTNPSNPITGDEVDALPVDGGLDALLAELVASPEGAALAEPARRRPRWPLVVAAAASVALVVAVPTYLFRTGDDGRPSEAAASSAPSASDTATATSEPPRDPEVDPQPVAWTGPSSYAVLEAHGWTIQEDGVQTDPDYGLSVSYTYGSRTFTLQWIKARWYDGVLESAEAEGSSSTIEVLGSEARYFTYESEQQMAYLPVDDGFGLRVDAAFTTPQEFEGLVRLLRVADESSFGEALPDDVVDPDKTLPTVLELLDGVEAPPVALSPPATYNSRSAVAHQVVGSVGCAWTQQFVEARADGDDAARDEAVSALQNSRDWPVLADELDAPRWFADLVQLMRDDAPDDRILGAGCARGLENSIG